jgi:hypothetical protein
MKLWRPQDRRGSLNGLPWPFVLVLVVVLVIDLPPIFDYDYEDDDEDDRPAGSFRQPLSVFAPSLFILWNAF